MTIYLDADMNNADWTKTTRDLGPPEQAIQTIFGPAGTHEEQQEALDRFMARPAARAMPEEVRSALIALGFTVRERYIVTGPGNENVVQAWSATRLPFEPKGWLRDLRAEIRSAMQALKVEPHQVLHAIYGSQTQEFCDAENILFYNVGSGYFSRLSAHGIRFERAFSHPAPPQPIPAWHLHYHRYATANSNDTFYHWQLGRTLAEWSDIQLPKITSATTASPLWHCMKSNSVDIRYMPNQEIKQFGLRVILKVPANDAFTISTAMKPVLDGLIAAFHVHNGKEIEQISQRLGKVLHADSSVMIKLLHDPSRAILGRRRLLWPFQQGVMWNPADDICFAAELLVERYGGNKRLISGSLFELEQRMYSW